MILISDSEKKYIREGVKKNVRVDGRSRTDFRYVWRL